MKITFLGTGGSLGVPLIGCKCPVCRSADRRNHRLRPSVLIETPDNIILIDTSPDFRQQALRNSIRRIDTLLLTHCHADHCLGLDDLRIVIDRQREPVALYSSAETIERLSRVFGYLLKSRIWNMDTPRFRMRPVESPIPLNEHTLTPLPVLHDRSVVLGWRIDDIAYVTDASYIPEETESSMHGLDLLIINLNDVPKLLRNDGGNSRNWLMVEAKLRGGKSDAIGARITVKTGSLTQIQDLIPVAGYLSQADHRRHFGLGKVSKADSVEIRWPDGGITRLTDVKANQFLTVTQEPRTMEQ